jgi:hypothetical protein
VLWHGRRYRSPGGCKQPPTKIPCHHGVVNGVSTYPVVSKSGASSLEVEHAQPDHVILASLARTLIAAAIPCGLPAANCTHAYLDVPRDRRSSKFDPSSVLRRVTPASTESANAVGRGSRLEIGVVVKCGDDDEFLPCSSADVSNISVAFG